MDEKVIIQILVNFCIAVLVSILIRVFIKPIIYTLTKKTKTELDDKIIEATANPIFIGVLIFLLWISVKPIYQNEILDNVIKSILAIIIFVIIYRVLRILIEELFPKLASSKLNLDNTILNLLRNILIVCVYVFLAIILLNIWNIPITPIVASVGLVSLAVGFALKDFIENILSGIIMFFDPPFKVGDIVELSNGKAGRVIDVGIRNTKIHLFSGEVIIVPNSQIINTNLINYELPDEKVRVSLRIGVSYDTDPEVVKKTILEILNEIPTILKEPQPQVLFLEFGDFALIFEIRFWVNIKDKMSTIDEVNTRIWKVFKEKGIEIPYPIRTIYMKK